MKYYPTPGEVAAHYLVKYYPVRIAHAPQFAPPEKHTPEHPVDMTDAELVRFAVRVGGVR